MPVIIGLGLLLAAVFLLPLGDEASTTPAYITSYVASYALALVPVALVLHGFPAFFSDLLTPRLLVFGAAAAIAGLLAVLPSRPEALADGAGLIESLSLSLANFFRLIAAASLGLALARYVTSPGVALLIAGISAASDLLSVLAGPTKILLREDSPALDFLLLVFPAFGQPLGFGLGVSDFIFLALFTYMSLSLCLRYRSTLIGCCAATLLAMTVGLLIGHALPALPFISLAFVLVNARPLHSSLAKQSR